MAQIYRNWHEKKQIGESGGERKNKILARTLNSDLNTVI